MKELWPSRDAPLRWSWPSAAATRRGRARALDAVVAAYWRPVFRHVRARWRADEEDAEDLAQGFFAAALEKGWLARYEPARGRFRTYLLACLDAFVANERRAGRRLKRGGGADARPARDARTRTASRASCRSRDGSDLEADFQREWAREPVRARGRGAARSAAWARPGGGVPALRALRPRGRTTPSERPRYADLAAEFGLPVTQVTNHLHWARRELRQTVLESCARSRRARRSSGAEARALLGVEPA